MIRLGTFTILIGLLVFTGACSCADPKIAETPQQIPELRPATDVAIEINKLNLDLVHLQATAQNLLEHSRKIAASQNGPSFDDQTETHVAEALKTCDDLQARSKTVSEHESLKNATGAAQNVKDILAEVDRLRTELRRIK